MHKRMGTIVVLLTLVLAAFTVSISDCSDAGAQENTPNTLGDSTYMYDATSVTAFTFPESQGNPVKNALASAEHSINISVYLLSSKDVLAILLEKVKTENVEVNILIDGTPLGVTSDIERLLQIDADSDGTVRLINFKGAENCEYDYLHNKYAVIDDKTVIVTTENWTQGNFTSSTGNRGWGAIIDSVGYAAYMKSIFVKDFEDDNDVEPIAKVYKDTKPAEDKVETYTAKVLKDVKAVTDVKVYPAHSPDTSFGLMKAYMATATTRLHVEQLDISPKYTDFNTDGPIKWMIDAAKRNVDVEYILDISYEKRANPEHSQLIYDLNHQTDVKASPIKGGKGFSITHNKGIIADNTVWLGSVNMTPTSFNKDREMAVIIYSSDIADYFEGYFNTDFNNNYDKEYKPGEYTPVDRVVDEVTEHPWYVAVFAAIIAAIGLVVRAVIKGGIKGGKKGAQKAARSSGKKAVKSVTKTFTKEMNKKKK